MTRVPQLLNTNNLVQLPSALFADLQMDRILSEETIAVLQQPCGLMEIERRNELFVLLDKDEIRLQAENALSVLSANRRAVYLLHEAEIPLDRYYRFLEMMESYIASCEVLTSMHQSGILFAQIAAYYKDEAKMKTLLTMKESAKKIRKLLLKMSQGFLSFADSHWLTPPYNAVSEFDSIAASAENLGFTVPQKKLLNTKINLSLSDAICHLFSDEVAQMEDEIARYSDIDFYEPTMYIPGIKFFLELHSLIMRAAKIGVPCCIAKIARTPKYIARELYDVSLLAKNCEYIIANDGNFTKKEPFWFLIGANGGGKTTYLRAVGINLMLFLAGCPVFAKEAEIYPFDIVLSHFPKDERFDNTGRLDEERKRTEEMLSAAQNKTAFLFFNETFSGTDEKRGFGLLHDVAAKIEKDGHFGIYVTHFHEVVSLNYPILQSKVDVTEENKRTFRIKRFSGNASSYAADILKKYRLDKDSLCARRCLYGN